MEPFLRRATAAGALAKPAPDGWAVESAGRWRDRRVEVVYDPARHDVFFHRGNTPPKLAGALTEMGWRHRGTDGPNEWWTRDRVEVARKRLLAHTGAHNELAIA